jgi:hypothetical protein
VVCLCSDAVKFLVVELACGLSGATQCEIGELDGGMPYTAVGTIPRKVRDGKHSVTELTDHGPNRPEARSRQT